MAQLFIKNGCRQTIKEGYAMDTTKPEETRRTEDNLERKSCKNHELQRSQRWPIGGSNVENGHRTTSQGVLKPMYTYLNIFLQSANQYHQFNFRELIVSVSISIHVPECKLPSTMQQPTINYTQSISITWGEYNPKMTN